MFENRALREIFGAKKDKVTGEWRRPHNEELYNLYCSPNGSRAIKSRKKKATRSVYDCTVEDVEYICNKFSLSVTHSRRLVVIILRCCARRAIL